MKRREKHWVSRREKRRWERHWAAWARKLFTSTSWRDEEYFLNQAQP